MPPPRLHPLLLVLPRPRPRLGYQVPSLRLHSNGHATVADTPPTTSGWKKRPGAKPSPSPTSTLASTSASPRTPTRQKTGLFHGRARQRPAHPAHSTQPAQPAQPAHSAAAATDGGASHSGTHTVEMLSEKRGLGVRIDTTGDPTTRPRHVLLHLPFHTPHTDFLLPPSASYPPGTTILSPFHTVPTPPFPLLLHDTLAAYDFAVNRYAQEPMVLGCGLSGGLALSVGLTERVRTVVLDPIVDWTAFGSVAWCRESRMWLELDVLEASEQLRAAKASGDAEETSVLQRWKSLNELRGAYFLGRPERWTDPFASPLFFLRTPGIDLWPPPEYIFRSAKQEQEGYDDDAGGDDETLHVPQRRRRWRRQFPTAGLTHVEMFGRPMGRVSVALEDPTLREQGIEFVRAARRTWIVLAQKRFGGRFDDEEERELDEHEDTRPGTITGQRWADEEVHLRDSEGTQGLHEWVLGELDMTRVKAEAEANADADAQMDEDRAES